MKKNEMVPIMVPVTPKVHEKLHVFKARTGNSMASIIRTAIDEYLERNTPTTLIPEK